MIHTVCLNPTVDCTLYLASLRRGGTNRIRRQLVQGGGKAVNVAIMLAHLGAAVKVHGILYEENAAPILEALGDIPGEFMRYEGSCRVNYKIFDESAGEITELNGSGPALGEERLAAFAERLAASVAAGDAVVLTGSLPPLCPPDTYARLMRALPGRHVLDADGDALRLAIGNHPALIKPNAAELGALLGAPIASVQDAVNGALALVRRGVGVCAVSLGAQGAIITDGRAAFFAPPLALAVDSTVGAGDCMLAGMLAALLGGGDIAEALALGTAAAGASIQLPGTALADLDAVTAMRRRVEVRAIRL